MKLYQATAVVTQHIPCQVWADDSIHAANKIVDNLLEGGVITNPSQASIQGIEEYALIKDDRQV
jgi:hypothetical protein